MNNTPGQRFGRWQLIAPASTRGGTKMVTCRCDCGTERAVSLGNLVRGMTTSCGCWRRERMALLARRGPRKDALTYAGAHMRIASSRGAASEYPCVDCAIPAQEWCLRHGAPSIQEDPSGRGRKYSLDPFDYDPRCYRCHRAYDKLARSGDLPENRPQE